MMMGQPMLRMSMKKLNRKTYNESPKEERGLEHVLGRLSGKPRLRIVGEGMGDGLESDDAAKPAVEQVVCVERNAQKGNERVVSAREEEQRDLFASEL